MRDSGAVEARTSAGLRWMHACSWCSQHSRLTQTLPFSFHTFTQLRTPHTISLPAVDADPSRAASAAAAGDVISRLVGIYGSKELFINEYRWGQMGAAPGVV